jgi:hypothetical protein
MSGFTLDHDAVRGVLLSRVDADFPDAQFEEYRIALRTAVLAARRRGPLRFLSDNRDNKIFGQERAEILWNLLCENAHPEDRIALLLASSLAKHTARGQAGARGEPFASENAAYTWLGAGKSLAA